jgi:ATP-dependent RNA helicase RhlE
MGLIQGARGPFVLRRRNETHIPTRQGSRPQAGFESFQLCRELQRGIAAAGFTEPRPIQTRTIPAVLEGRDVLGLAQTGTGKTAAFVLPILERLRVPRSGARTGPRALIVAPTRELAMQIHAELQLLARYTPVRAATVFGGVPAGAQIRALRNRPDILVACPGRLLDLWQQGAARLDAVEVLVLDEADHMFDMGFLPDVRRILAALPARRQNLLFSATMPKEIRGLADRLLERPHVVELEHSTPAATIDHALYPVPETRKVDLLRHLVSHEGFTSAIVFLRTKHRTKRLAERLSRLGLDAVALQGNMSQGQRDRAMKGFRGGRFRLLVATDIVARGIDVAGISHVVNYDVPTTPDAYTHRIGRTGRAERSGKACTFVTGADAELVRAIEKRLGAAIPRVHVPGFADGKPEARPERTASRTARAGASGGSVRRGQQRSTGGAQRPFGDGARRSGGDAQRSFGEGAQRPSGGGARRSSSGGGPTGRARGSQGGRSVRGRRRRGPMLRAS